MTLYVDLPMKLTPAECVKKRDITAEQVRALLHYEPETGEFWWRGTKGRASGKAGSIFNGRLHIGIAGERFRAHRLAWLYVTGKMPRHVIDHKDGDPLNNRFDNLRDVARRVNQENQRRAKVTNVSSGLLGVQKNNSGKWQAVITAHGKRTCHGTFATPELAHEAYLTAKRRLHEGCTL